MKVFKFGGASVKDARAVKNVAEILGRYQSEQLIVVVSAMGKTTNALEAVVKSYVSRNKDVHEKLEEVKNFHTQVSDELFGDDEYISNQLNNIFVEIEWMLEDEPGAYDYCYDQIVSQGEMLSTTLVAAWLSKVGMSVQWIDARDLIRTDNTYREGKVDWKTSAGMVDEVIKKNRNTDILLTQGFIGGTSENYTTTLGREGSDYSAAILAYLTHAESVTIWKDVPGVMNADPKWFSDCVLLEHLSYQDAIELAYYGASVIHPKTIKPLQNRKIPLFVKSFLDPGQACTEISDNHKGLPVPGFIFKVNQVLISISPRDFSFIVEENLRQIFDVLSRYRVHINIMQNSALSFTFCTDYDPEKLEAIVKELSAGYAVRYNTGVELVTVRHADQLTVDRVTQNKEILLDVRSRNTVQMVVRSIPA